MRCTHAPLPRSKDGPKGGQRENGGGREGGGGRGDGGRAKHVVSISLTYARAIITRILLNIDTGRNDNKTRPIAQKRGIARSPRVARPVRRVARARRTRATTLRTRPARRQLPRSRRWPRPRARAPRSAGAPERTPGIVRDATRVDLGPGHGCGRGFALRRLRSRSCLCLRRWSRSSWLQAMSARLGIQG